MLSLGPIAFLQPWLLAGLLALPVLWWLLRVLPPAPKRVAFPAIRLLFGLESAEKTPSGAPWWLILMRLAAAALLILAVADPVMNPERQLAGSGPLVLAVDDGYAAAPQWSARQARLKGLVERAGREGRAVHLLTTARAADGTPPSLSDAMPAPRALDAVDSLDPKPWPTDRAAALSALEGFSVEGSADVYWASDGLDDPSAAAFATRLQRLGQLTVMTPDSDHAPVLTLPPRAGSTRFDITLRRAEAGAPRRVTLVARGADGRPLMRRPADFAAGESETTVTLDMPGELRNQVASVGVESAVAPGPNADGEAPATAAGTALGAGAVALFDERWRRRPVGIVSAAGRDVGLALLSEVYYLDRALAPIGDLSRAPADILLRSGQAAIFLPDSTPVNADTRDQLAGWIEEGGVLVRFAGPRLAQARDDDLVPVPLRRGGRQLSGAMQWTQPAKIGEASETGPFADLTIESDAVIKRQVLAEPSLDLSERTWLRLEDDTPLVTAEKRGDGWLVLVHTTANTEWSTLALSGLFVEMLKRLTELGAGVPTTTDGADRPLPPVQTLDGFGALQEPPVTARPIAAEARGTTPIGPAHPPGFYGTDTARHAVSLGPRIERFEALESLPAGVAQAGFARADEKPLDPWLYVGCLVLILLDGLVTLVLRGLMPGLSRLAQGGAGARTAASLWLAAGLAAALAAGPNAARAQSFQDENLQGDAFALRASTATVLAYVETGDTEIDRASRAGLSGLSAVLRQRTAVEAAEPMGVDPSEDELAFFPLLYWPVTDAQAALRQGAVDRLNRYMANGGTILFDMQDGHLSGSALSGASGPLQRITQGLDVPELTPVPPEHVLTKSFYLMQDFPGRWTGETLWIERPGTRANDGVARILVGAADWAGAWAVDEAGRPLFPVVPGGDRQREMAYRFGVNLVMYVLTGNYKADQVHIPAILERLGQ